MLKTPTIADLRDQIGTELGVSRYHYVCQAAVDAFAGLTDDQQWIHIDPERARDTAFGGTIAHGYYTLALAPTLLADVLDLDSFGMAVNYGLDRLRFPAPLLVGESVRMRVALLDLEEIPGGATLTLLLTFECEQGGKPVCVAVALYRVIDA